MINILEKLEHRATGNRGIVEGMPLPLLQATHEAVEIAVEHHSGGSYHHFEEHHLRANLGCLYRIPEGVDIETRRKIREDAERRIAMEIYGFVLADLDKITYQLCSRDLKAALEDINQLKKKLTT